MVNRAVGVLVVLLAGCWIGASIGYGQDPPDGRKSVTEAGQPPAGGRKVREAEDGGIDSSLQYMIKKGIISRDEAARMKDIYRESAPEPSAEEPAAAEESMTFREPGASKAAPVTGTEPVPPTETPDGATEAVAAEMETAGTASEPEREPVLSPENVIPAEAGEVPEIESPSAAEAGAGPEEPVAEAGTQPDQEAPVTETPPAAPEREETAAAAAEEVKTAPPEREGTAEASVAGEDPLPMGEAGSADENGESRANDSAVEPETGEIPVAGAEETAAAAAEEVKTAAPEQALEEVVILNPAAEGRKQVEELRKDLDEFKQDALTGLRQAKQEHDQLENRFNDDIRKQLDKSSWAQRIRISGDVRLRYQKDYFDEKNADILDPEDPDELMNTTIDRERERIRARIGIKAKVFEPKEVNPGTLEAGLSVTTGNEKDPVSTNETLGDYGNRDSVVLDQAYLKWVYAPQSEIWGLIPQLQFLGGRFANPYFSSDLIWDSDLNFEGAAVTFVTDTMPEHHFSVFFTTGFFPLQEEELVRKDKWFYGWQAGIELKELYGFGFKLAYALYDFQNITGVVNDPERPGLNDWTAPLFQQKGNTLFDIDPGASIRTALAADYKETAVTGQLEYTLVYPIKIVLKGEYVKNTGFDRQAVSRRTGLAVEDIKEAIEGYRVEFLLGKPEVSLFGDWNISMFNKKLESDAVLDAFTDSDFHLGGTNADGWGLGLELGLFRNFVFSSRWISSNEIDGPQFSVDTLQVDLRARF